MPPLLQSAQLKPDVTITSADDNSDIDDSDDERYNIFFKNNLLPFMLEKYEHACIVCLNVPSLPISWYPS